MKVPLPCLGGVLSEPPSLRGRAVAAALPLFFSAFQKHAFLYHKYANNILSYNILHGKIFAKTTVFTPFNCVVVSQKIDLFIWLHICYYGCSFPARQGPVAAASGLIAFAWPLGGGRQKRAQSREAIAARRGWVNMCDVRGWVGIETGERCRPVSFLRVG